jgi:hypothetical protein
MEVLEAGSLLAASVHVDGRGEREASRVHEAASEELEASGAFAATKVEGDGTEEFRESWCFRPPNSCKGQNCG